MESDTVYNLGSNPSVFYAGRINNGNQVLIGVQLPEIVIVEFDTQGNFLTFSVQDLPEGGQDSTSRAYNLEMSEIPLQVIQETLGFTPSIIAIKRFFLEDRWIGIEDLPDHYQDVIDYPENYDEERLQELREDIRSWRENGDFVFFWCEDYYIDRDGDIASS
jgi:hypothetical protein